MDGFLFVVLFLLIRFLLRFVLTAAFREESCSLCSYACLKGFNVLLTIILEFFDLSLMVNGVST